MWLWIEISARDTSRTGSADPANSPQSMRTRTLRSKKKMSVPLNPQHKTTPPSTNTRKVVTTTKKTTENTPCSPMQKPPRKKLHRGTKANWRRWIRLRGLTTAMKMMTKPVPRTTTSTETETETATAEVTDIPAPEEATQNGWGSWAQARYLKRLVLWQRPKHPRRQNRGKPKAGKT